MKRILTALILSLAISSLFAVNLDVTVTSGNFELYDAYGYRSDPNTVSDMEGLIVLTNDEEVTFSTAYGDITLSEGSIFSILSLDVAAPTFYLVDGSARFDLKEDIYIQVYTPVTLTALSKTGSYQIITSEDEEAIYNYSGSEAVSLDALSGNSYIIEPETYSSLTAMILNKPLRETEDVDVKEEEGTEEIPEVVINIPSRPTIISIEGEVITPSVPEIEVGDITLPPVPEAPVLTYDYSTPKTAVLTVKDQVLTGEVIPTRPYISVVRSEMGVPSRPDILSITYESNLVPPTVRVFEVEKKTLTE